jgi:Prolipoprotein diacylglyceryl transferase
MTAREIFNGHLDGLARVEVRVFRKSLSAFQVPATVGLLLAIVLTMTLVVYLGLSLPVMTVIVVVTALTFLALTMATKIIIGQEQLVHYHHQIAIMAVTTLLLWLLGSSILPYLDITILGIGAFMVAGRLGCLMVGCCHGRPSRWGVCYRQEHADAGLVSYYVGVRLFPAQLIESLGTFMNVCIGSLFAFAGRAPGTFLAWYVVTYGLGRFCLEFWRGDPERPYLWGYSEAQWIAVVMVCFVVIAEGAGVLPRYTWHSLAFGGLLFAMLGISLKRSFQCATARQLLYPLHVKEVAEVLELVTSKASEITPFPRWFPPRQSSSQQQILIACTSLGVQVSASKIKDATNRIWHYALSQRDGGMTEETARPLAKLIFQLRRANGSSEFLTGNKGVFHLLIHTEG